MIELGVHALTAAVEAARDYSEKAEQEGIEDVERVQNYLRAAHVAIIGLEREYDQILVQAKYCELDDPDEVKALKERIDKYLTVDELRPELIRAVKGAADWHVELAKNADRFLQLPGVKRGRKRSVAGFGELINTLQKYTIELEKNGLQFRPAGTGVAVESLENIKQHLDFARLDQGHPKDLIEIVASAQADRTKDGLKDFTEKIQGTLDELIAAFR